MFRPVLIALPLVLAPLAFSTAAAAQGAGQNCQQRNEGRHRAGGMLGGMARGMLGHFGGSAADVILPVGSLLGDAIMNLLDCDEQQKAANATEQAVRGGVGTTTSWQSETRPGVTGSSTVTAATNTAADGECVTVTDVVIVDGQETRAPKRMCRRPPNNRFVRV
jgi:predicted lipid-binding transport protein (Tim44 family)